MNFYPVPPVIEARVLTRIPEELRCKGESDWRGGFTGAFQNIFLEGPTCDEDGHLYLTDIPYGRILRIDKHSKQATVCVQYDGEPNGMSLRKDGKFVVADYKKVSSIESNSFEKRRADKFTRAFFCSTQSQIKSRPSLQETISRVSRVSTM